MNKRTKYFYYIFLSIIVWTDAFGQIYKDPSQSVEIRVKDLLSRMSLEEKVQQLQSQMVYTDFDNRDFRIGHVRNPAHFLHKAIGRKATAKECAEKINEDTEKSIAASAWGIPTLQNGEALHGAQWGYATSFPQSIGMAASFDPELYYRVGCAVAKELRAVGVRQVFAPVVNICRDSRWGRAEETYGEDVLLTSRMGVAYTKALEDNGIIATPKHFVDNYGDGGRDSHASNTSWRTLREVYLEPFRACVQEGGARSMMVAYNSIDGLPCTSNRLLIDSILRKEWGFRGVVVSDYNGVNGIYLAHRVASDHKAAQALSFQAGVDVDLPNGYPDLLELVQSGKITEAQIDSSVYRVLKCKFELGLFEEATVDARKADNIVACKSHVTLAHEAAVKCMTLLKNENQVLPLSVDQIKRVGVFGPAANIVSLGGYTGPFGGRKDADYMTPFQGLKNYLRGKAEVLLYTDSHNHLNDFVKNCDVAIFFASIHEGEGADRSKLNLPAQKMHKVQSRDNAIIVGEQVGVDIQIDQEQMILDLAASGVKTIVVLQNGSYIDIRKWIDHVDGVIEAWYAGEKGAIAIAETLFGEHNPGGRLPFTWAKHPGQLPCYYAMKPSGRGYAYNDDDGKPMFPFGYGLSYTTFSYSDLSIPSVLERGDTLKVSVTVTNTGKVDGDDVVQLYVKDGVVSVVRPLIELKAFQRVSLKAGESKRVTLEIPYRNFGFWNANMEYVVESRTITIALSSDVQTPILTENVFIR